MQHASHNSTSLRVQETFSFLHHDHEHVFFLFLKMATLVTLLGAQGFGVMTQQTLDSAFFLEARQRKLRVREPVTTLSGLSSYASLYCLLKSTLVSQFYTLFFRFTAFGCVITWRSIKYSFIDNSSLTSF